MEEIAAVDEFVIVGSDRFEASLNYLGEQEAYQDEWEEAERSAAQPILARSSVPETKEQSYLEETIWDTEKWGDPYQDIDDNSFDHIFQPFQPISLRFRKIYSQWLTESWLRFAPPPFFSCVLCKTQGVVYAHNANAFLPLSQIRKYREPFRHQIHRLLGPQLLEPSLCNLVQAYAEPIPFLFACRITVHSQIGEVRTLCLDLLKVRPWDSDIFEDASWIASESTSWICSESIHHHLKPSKTRENIKELLDQFYFDEKSLQTLVNTRDVSFLG
jgi:hypothetical protein